MTTDFASTDTPNLYYDRYFQLDAVKILPGEYYVTQRDMLISTVLGSCVSVCLRDTRRLIGGMNHFMLPGNPDDSATDPVSSSARYGVYAMELMLNRLLKLGAQRRCLEAKVFGGASVLKGFGNNHVGRRNAEFALEFLRTESIPVAAQDLLDVHPRRVCFFPASGRVMLKKLRAVHDSSLVEREMEYSRKIGALPVTGNIDLF